MSVEDRPSSKQRKRRGNQEGNVAQEVFGKSKGKNGHSDIYQYATKRTPTPSHLYNSYGDNSHATAGIKVSRASSRNGELFRNCSRTHNRNDTVLLDNACYDTEDDSSNTHIMLPKNSLPKMDSFQNNNPKEYILKKRVRFQLNPSKSTPNFRHKEEKTNHTVPELKHYSLPKKSQANHSRNADQMPSSSETHRPPLADKSYAYIYEDDIHSPDDLLGKKTDAMFPSRHYNSMYRGLSNLDLNCQDTNEFFDSDASNDSDNENEKHRKEAAPRSKVRQFYTSQQQSRGSRQKDLVEVSDIPSRLPRPVTKIVESARSRPAILKPQHNTPKFVYTTLQRGGAFTKDDTNANIQKYKHNFQRSGSPSGTYHDIRKIRKQREYSNANELFNMLDEQEVINSDSSEDDDNVYIPRQQREKTKIRRERIVPDNITKDVEKYVLDLNGYESSDDDYNVEYSEHTLTSRPSQSQNSSFVSTTARMKKDDRDMSYKNRTTAHREADYRPKRRKNEISTPDDDIENDFRNLPVHSQTYPAKQYREPDHEKTRRKTTKIESSGKITRMSKAKEDLGEYEQQEDLDQHIKLQQGGISNGAFTHDHKNLKLTKYDMIEFNQTEETHRMFMEVWLPSRASSRTYSKLKRSIWDTPAHLLVLKQIHTQNI